MDRTAENREREQQKLPLIHCPFDCGPADVAPHASHAYCCHLVGFTRDEKERIFEPLEQTAWGDHFAVNGRKPQRVQPGDVVVNPIVRQKTTSGINLAKMWVSARVYRPCTPEQAEAWRTKHARPEDFAVMAELQEDDKDLRIKELESELKRLKGPAVLGEVDEDAEVAGPEWREPTEEDLADEVATVAKK